MSLFYKPYKIIIQRSLQDRGMCKAQAINKKRIKKLRLTGKGFCKKGTFCCGAYPALMTVEAAVILPLFLMAVLIILDFSHMLGFNGRLLGVLARSVHVAGVHGYGEDFGTDTLFAELMTEFGASSMDFSKLFGGMAGIDYRGTEYDKESGSIHICTSYAFKPVFSLGNLGRVRSGMSMHGRAFIGGKLLSRENDKTGGEMLKVYVAENGIVYHKSQSCAHIDLSLHAVGGGDVSGLRNSQGGKYYACERCHGSGSVSVVYITDTGNRYHSTAECSGVRRTVYTMIWTPDCVLPPCSRCGG